MPRRGRVVFTTLFASLALTGAASASAGPPAVDSAEFGALAQVAASHWGGVPCGGAVSYRYTTLPARMEGYASWMRPDATPKDPSTFRDCRVDLNAASELDDAQLCTVLTHELGHLWAYDHSADPGDVMFPTLRGSLPACAAAFPATKPARAVPAAAPAASRARVRRARSRAVARPRVRQTRKLGRLRLVRTGPRHGRR